MFKIKVSFTKLLSIVSPDEDEDSKYQGDVSDRVLLDCNEWYQSVTLSPAVISILFCHPNLRSELYSG